MTELRELTEGGQALVSESFLDRGVALTDDDLGPYLEPTGVHVDLEGLHEAVDRTIADTRSEDADVAKLDGRLAPVVHRELDLTRRQAARTGIWHWLALLEFPEFVFYRWGHQRNKLREKFLKGGTDIYSNAIHRLWWIAELTHDGDDYRRTEEIFELQELANDVADRWFARYRPITYACVDVLNVEAVDDLPVANSKIVSDTTTRLRERLSVTLAEGLDYDEAVELVEDLREDVVAENA